MLEELRFGWSVVALLLLVVLLQGVSLRWLLLTAVPWLAGAAVLWSEHRGAAAAAALASLASTRAVRRALLVLGAVLFLAGFVFSPAAALHVFAWANAGALLLAAAGKTALLQHVLAGAAVASMAATVLLGGAEAVLRTPWFAWKLGTPQERAAWRQRYDKVRDHNLFRFRSRHETVARRAGVQRIFAVGDDLTWGDRVAQTDSVWPARLERALRRTYPQSDFEVISAGRNGWTTANEAELLRRLGWQFNPDLVVMQYSIDDALPSGPDLQSTGSALVYPRARLLPLQFRTGVVRSSALLHVLETKLSFLAPSLSFSATYEDSWPGWLQMKAALREIGDSSRARATPVVLVVFPSPVEGRHTVETYPFRPIIEKVHAVATAAGLHVLDLTPTLAAQGGDWRRWWATPDEANWSSAAHGLAALAITEFIAHHGWLAPTALVADSASGS